MAYFGYRQALVNRSGSNIPVYETLVHSEVHVGGTTAGGTKIGTIYPNEFYTIIPNDSMYITSYKIIFRDPKGNQKFGYIETNPANKISHNTILSLCDDSYTIFLCYTNVNSINFMGREYFMGRECPRKELK